MSLCRIPDVHVFEATAMKDSELQDQHLFQAGSCDVGALALDSIIGHRENPCGLSSISMAAQLVK